MNVIDIGSNSVRLLCDGKKTVLTTMLAKDMRDGYLDPDSIARTVDAVAELCRMCGGNAAVFATEAVRKAVNKDVFLSGVLSATGLKVNVLSGDDEAEIGFLGATDGDGPAVVVDLGGASCEIIFGAGGKIDFKASYPFGCVTMTDKFGFDCDGIKRYVAELTRELPRPDAGRLIVIGGTATSLAAMALGLEEYDPAKVDGYELTLPVIERLIREVAEGKAFATLATARRKTIRQGASALAAVMERLAQDSALVSEKDNLEGYAIKYETAEKRDTCGD